MPQDELPQLTFHETPALLLSLLTVAISPVLVPTLRDVGGELRKETEIGLEGGGVTVPLLQAINNRTIAQEIPSWIR